MTWRYSAFLLQYRKVQAPQMGESFRLATSKVDVYSKTSPDPPVADGPQATTPRRLFMTRFVLPRVTCSFGELTVLPSLPRQGALGDTSRTSPSEASIISKHNSTLTLSRSHELPFRMITPSNEAYLPYRERHLACFTTFVSTAHGETVALATPTTSKLKSWGSWLCD